VVAAAPKAASFAVPTLAMTAMLPLPSFASITRSQPVNSNDLAIPPLLRDLHHMCIQLTE